MQYHLLRHLIKKSTDRRRVARNLLSLRKHLDKRVPAKDAEDNLLLATWNIRDFAKKNRRGWGKRLPESWFYIAEIISRFDFVAVQEINEIVPEWKTVMNILGHEYDYIATDETDWKLGGNGERMAFVYDKRKVSFQNIAGEIVLPPDMLISAAELEVADGKKVTAGNQFKRTPFMAMFQSGWLKFDVCTVHLYYGARSGEKLEQRVEEIGKIADYLSKRADRALGGERALLLLGDFNIVSPEHKTMRALLERGFEIPNVLRDKPTTGTAKHYDQIAFKTKPSVLEYVDRESEDPRDRNAGVLDLSKAIFTTRQFAEYRDVVAKSAKGKKVKDDDAKLKKVYKEWRTYQSSDHFPMWVRLQTNGSDAYLERLSKEGEDA